MTLAGVGLKRQQVEAVRTRMAVWQEAIVGVPALSQLGVTRVDLHDGLNDGAVALIPPHPPPAVPATRRGDEPHVTAVVAGHQLTTEAATVRASAHRYRGPRQQLGTSDAGVCSAARPRGPRRSETCHRPITDLGIPR